LSGEIGVDVVVVTPEEVERYRDTHCLVICPAMRERRSFMKRKKLAPDDPHEWLRMRSAGNVQRSFQQVGCQYDLA
jgi:hypothetical protein